MPNDDTIHEKHNDIEIFQRLAGEKLYRIWPKEPLEPGEYAVVEYSPGEGNIQVWDFAYRPVRIDL